MNRASRAVLSFALLVLATACDQETTLEPRDAGPVDSGGSLPPDGGPAMPDAGPDAGPAGPDLDGDGWVALTAGGTDCDDGNPDIHPGIVEDESWTGVEIGVAGERVAAAAIEVAADDTLHVVHQANGGTPNYHHLTQEGGSWTRETVVAGSAGIGGLAFTPAGEPVIAVLAGADVYFAFRGPTEWEGDSLGAGPAFAAPAIGVGPDARIHIGIGGADGIHRGTAGAWTVETFATGASLYDLAVDGAGNDHAVYGANVTDCVDGSLCAPACAIPQLCCAGVCALPTGRWLLGYTTNRSGGFVPTELPATEPRHASITSDAAGDAHVGFVDTNGLHYASNATGDWATQFVATTEGAAWTGVAVDALGAAHLVVDDASGMRRHATNESGTWRVEALGPARDTTDSGVVSNAVGAGHVHTVTVRGEDLTHWRRSVRDGIDRDCDGAD